ncbi:hypothetical protein LCGC14_1405960 [marine sediment metagenome]|uniref:Uncharacterized protein n=1 Tax=marine sediment metagenome TaxID=412755 RepID=A0A0F9MX97_9ZZZZ
MRLGCRTKSRLRRTAKRYARTSGKDWVTEVGVLYANETARRTHRALKR